MGKYKNVHRVLKSMDFKRFARAVSKTNVWETSLTHEDNVKNGTAEPKFEKHVVEEAKKEEVKKVAAAPVKKDEPFGMVKKADVTDEFSEGGMKTFEAPKKVYGRKNDKFNSKKDSNLADVKKGKK